jgi:hypothetical protein
MYVLYASGEVLLVVIGIILALQLDNLHSQNVEKDILANHLATVLENLEDDRTQLLRLRQEREESWNRNSPQITVESTDYNLLRYLSHQNSDTMPTMKH